MAGFLIEVTGLTPTTVADLRDSPVAQDSPGILAATLVREPEALATVDLDRPARRVPQRRNWPRSSHGDRSMSRALVP
jgi:hypothetical protein